MGLCAVARQAAEDGLPVKPVGSGHSFTAATGTEGPPVEDADAGKAVGSQHFTVEAGTRLRDLDLALARECLSPTSTGDTVEQTVTGTICRGTHGAGRSPAANAARTRDPVPATANGSPCRRSSALGHGRPGGEFGSSVMRPSRARVGVFVVSWQEGMPGGWRREIGCRP
ncbi:FAD-binding protein [Streptomyces torulosus]|uniref:FAD-binding protein n=1 Tax=Streptomyces torulosus TaxID=68276 RepID=UPI003B838A9A